MGLFSTARNKMMTSIPKAVSDSQDTKGVKLLKSIASMAEAGITPSLRDVESVGSVRDTIVQEFLRRTASLEKTKEKLQGGMRLFDLGQKDHRETRELIEKKRKPHLIRSNDIQKEISRLQREFEKEQKALRDIESQTNEYNFKYKKAEEAYSENKEQIKKIDADLLELENMKSRTLANVKELLMQSMVASGKAVWKKMLDGDVPSAQWAFDKATNNLMFIFPFNGHIWGDVRKGSTSKEAMLAGIIFYRLLSKLKPEWQDVGVVAKEEYTLVYIKNPSQEFMDGAFKNGKLSARFILSFDPTKPVEPHEYIRIPDDFFAEVRNAFF